VLLAGLVGVRPRERVVDLGTGCAVIPLIVAYRGQGRSIVGVEIQPELVRLARKNVEVNGFVDSIRVLEADFKEITSSFPPGTFDLVLSNPPYRRLASGRINAVRQRAVARHELAGSVEDVFRAASHLLVQGGRLALIYPASRVGLLFVLARRYGFNAKRFTVIHSNASEPARLVYFECRKGGGEELLVTAPFFIYREDGNPTDAMRALYEG